MIRLDLELVRAHGPYIHWSADYSIDIINHHLRLACLCMPMSYQENKDGIEYFL